MRRTLVIVVCCLSLLVIGSSSSAQCSSTCQNPRRTGSPRIISAGCDNFCFSRTNGLSVSYQEVRETSYSCSNGGTCVVRETYTAPCGIC